MSDEEGAMSVIACQPLVKLFAWAEPAACDAPLLWNLGGCIILKKKKK